MLEDREVAEANAPRGLPHDDGLAVVGEAEARGDEALAVIYDDAASQLVLAKDALLDAEDQAGIAEVRGRIDSLCNLLDRNAKKVA